MAEKKKENIPALKTTLQFEMPIKRIEAALFWLYETTKAKTIDDAIGAASSMCGRTGNKTHFEMTGMIAAILRASREGKIKPALNMEEWYSDIAD